MKKKIICISIISIILVICVNIFLYLHEGHSLIYNLLSKKNVVPYEYMEYNGQKYDIGNYIITLESSIYDSKTGLGYCVFSIREENGSVDNEVDMRGNLISEGFGEQNSLNFAVQASALTYFEKKKGILYAYISFNHDTLDDDWGIYIEDMNSQSSENDGMGPYKFTIPDNAKVAEYKIDDANTLYVSAIGASLISDIEHENLYVCIDIDGEEDIVYNPYNDVLTEGAGTDVYTDTEKGINNVQHKFWFTNPIDISQITDVTVKY